VGGVDVALSRKFIVYGIVGVFVTTVKLSLLFLLRDVAEVQEYLSITVSYVIAVILHYLLNKHVTFMVKDRRVVNVMTLKYMATLLIAFIVYTGNIFLLNRIVGLPFYFSVFIALGVSYIVNFLLYEKIVFVTESSSPGPLA
jgi:putative flippase GtrA